MATKTLANGAVYDLDRKRIVGHRRDLATVNTQITTANASAMQARSVERKRAVIRDAANDAVERNDWRVKYGDDAYLAALGASMMAVAQTVEAPHSVRAAQWLVTQTGLDEGRAGAVTVDAPQGDDLVMIVMRRRLMAGDVVDGEIAE